MPATTEMRIYGVVCPHCEKDLEEFYANVDDSMNNISPQVIDCNNEECLRSFVIEGLQKFTGKVFKITNYEDE